MLIIWCSEFNVIVIEDDVSVIAIEFRIWLSRINRHVVEIRNVNQLMFSFFDDSRKNFIAFLNSFDLIQCSDIVSIVESNDIQHCDDFDTISIEIMIDSIIVCVAKVF
jgi:hypothetical protein